MVRAADVIQKAHSALVMWGAYLKSTPEEQAEVKIAVVVAYFNDATFKCRTWLREHGLNDLAPAKDWLQELQAEADEHAALKDLVERAGLLPPRPMNKSTDAK